MTFEEAAGIVGMTPPKPAKPDYAAKLNKAIADFEEAAEYRMEVRDDVFALERMGEMLARTIGDAELSGRSNCYVSEPYFPGATINKAPKAIDLIDAFCDQLGPGADIVRYSALNTMEKRS